MSKKECLAFIKRKNLINRLVDMLYYLKIFEKEKITIEEAHSQIKTNILDIYFLENLLKYFDQKLKKYNNKIQLKCNLRDLISDLDFLKQYLEE